MVPEMPSHVKSHALDINVYVVDMQQMLTGASMRCPLRPQGA